MINFADIKNIISDYKKKVDQAIICIGVDDKKQQIAIINEQIQDETIWSDNTKMSKLMQEKSHLQKDIEIADEIIIFLKDCTELLQMAEEYQDNETAQQIYDDLLKWQQKINNFEITSLFKNAEDKMDCFIEINSGAGGTESQDWVQILLRMYTMWAQNQGFIVEIIDKVVGEEVGFKQIVLLIKGYLAYGYLKHENGIHRLVRLSPFNSQNKRQTTFGGVFCYPAIDETINIEINEKDIRIDTYKSSGAGGQHVNTTDSAIRITHIPTNTVVQSQTQRSQMQNRAEAMKMLKSKLYEIEISKQNKNKDNIEANKNDIAFGNQIRNYVLHPYQLVKDLRSGYETSQTNKVLDGDLNDIIYSLIIP